MERDEAEETARTQADAEAQTDAVDHERLARLVGARREPDASYLPTMPLAARKSNALLIALVIVIVALALVGGTLFFRSKSAINIVPPQPTPRTAPSQSANPITHNIKPELIMIPGGTFQMGRSGTSIIEGPAHAVAVQPFAMDRTEVTNAQYELFVRETKYKVPVHFVNNKPLAGQEFWPVTNVSYEDAIVFAAWRSKHDGVTYRLPTEEEWEFAARNGEQATLYPWGNTWEQDRAVIDEGAPRPVGSLPEGKNQWGVVDLIGNVWEWTASKASLYPGNDAEIPAKARDWMVYRGGSYATEMSKKPATGTVRDWQKPSTTHPTLGFRLVRETR